MLRRRRVEAAPKRAARGPGWEARRASAGTATARAARGGGVGRWAGCAPPAQRPCRGGNVQPRRGTAPTLHVKPKGRAVETCGLDKPFAPKARLSCVDRLKVIRSRILPCTLHERAETCGATQQRATTASAAP